MCYNCDEKHEVGHRCNNRQLNLIKGEEEECNVDNEDSKIDHTEAEDPVISVHA